MPSYDYACRDCGYRFIATMPASEVAYHEVHCPRCGAIGADRLIDVSTARKGHMRETRVTLPELLFVGFTRGLLGVGLGLLLSRRIPKHRHLMIGSTLAAIGALTTIPIAMRLRARRALATNGTPA